MFDSTSRYYNVENTSINLRDGEGSFREIKYLRRRFIPSSEGMTTLLEHSVRQGDRLDNITARYLGDPTQFWRLCDTNNVMRPDELEEIGKTIKITLPF